MYHIHSFASLAARMPLYKVFKPRSATQMPSYSQNQSVFTLSILANLGSAIPGQSSTSKQRCSTINAQLLNFLPEIGTWNVVWGPAVHLAFGSETGRQRHVRRKT